MSADVPFEVSREGVPLPTEDSRNFRINQGFWVTEGSTMIVGTKCSISWWQNDRLTEGAPMLALLPGDEVTFLKPGQCRFSNQTDWIKTWVPE